MESYFSVCECESRCVIRVPVRWVFSVLVSRCQASIFHRAAYAGRVMCVAYSVNKCTAVRITISQLCTLSAPWLWARMCLISVLCTALECRASISSWLHVEPGPHHCIRRVFFSIIFHSLLSLNNLCSFDRSRGKGHRTPGTRSAIQYSSQLTSCHC